MLSGKLLGELNGCPAPKPSLAVRYAAWADSAVQRLRSISAQQYARSATGPVGSGDCAMGRNVMSADLMSALSRIGSTRRSRERVTQVKAHRLLDLGGDMRIDRGLRPWSLVPGVRID